MAVKLTYHPNLYLGESINAQKLDKIKRKLEKKPLLSGVFVLALSKNPKDQLEFYAARELVQRYYEKNPPCVVGLAGSYEEAMGLVERLAQDCLRARGDCALKEYLICGM